CRIMIGIALSLAPMSNDNVSRRISEISLGPISKRTTIHSPEFRDPFLCSADELSIDMKEQLKSDSRLKHLPSFVILGSNDQLCDIALKMLLLLAPTYFCFSRLTVLKTKYRNRAQFEDDLRICLSNIAPRFEDLRSA